MIPDTRTITREEIEAELGRLDARERGLREQRRDAGHRLELIVREREQLQRHLDSLFYPNRKHMFVPREGGQWKLGA